MDKILSTSEQTAARTDFVERYCPHRACNVLLQRRRDGAATHFSCLKAEQCELRPRVQCAHGKTVSDEK